jgi:TolA-binding protein
LLYGEFAKENKESFMAPAALLGKARCLESLSQYAEAKLVYEDVITYYPGSGWSQAAEANLQLVMNKLK